MCSFPKKNARVRFFVFVIILSVSVSSVAITHSIEEKLNHLICVKYIETRNLKKKVEKSF